MWPFEVSGTKPKSWRECACSSGGSTVILLPLQALSGSRKPCICGCVTPDPAPHHFPCLLVNEPLASPIKTVSRGIGAFLVNSECPYLKALHLPCL